MLTFSFDSKGSISIINFFPATFKIARSINRIQDGAAIWMSLHYVNGTLKNTPISWLCTTEKSLAIAASVRIFEDGQNLFRSYPEIVTYFLTRFTTDKAIAKFNAALLL